MEVWKGWRGVLLARWNNAAHRQFLCTLEPSIETSYFKSLAAFSEVDFGCDKMALS